MGYIDALNRLLQVRKFDVFLPTHEQAWLLSQWADRIDSGGHFAVATASAFAQVQSKLQFAQLLDRLNLPQPSWATISSISDLAGWSPPYYIKAPYSTAGRGVRRVVDWPDEAVRSLRNATSEGPLMVQAVARGRYAQVQGLFNHGQLIGVHTSMATAMGIGPSAAARESVDHPFARRDIARLGEELAWHGGLTLDYFFDENGYSYVECNARTVEPANAAASGIDIAQLQVELSLGESPCTMKMGRPGVRTHSLLAIILGTAAYQRERVAVLRDVVNALFLKGSFYNSREGLTPILADPLSVIPLMTVTIRVLFDPSSAETIATKNVKNYSVSGPEVLPPLL